MSTYASYSRLGTSRVVPMKTTVAPVAGSATLRRTASTSIVSSTTSASRTGPPSPPLTGGTSASSSPCASAWSGLTYSRATAVTNGAFSGRPASAPSRSATIASATVAPSASSSSSVPAPACSRRLAKSLTVTSMP